MNEELARCAQINFENLEKALPPLKQHPYYLIAKAQLDESLGGKTVEETINPYMKTFNLPVGKCSEMAHCFVDNATRCECNQQVNK